MDFSSFHGFEWDLGNIAKIQNRLDLGTVEYAFHGRPYVALDTKHSASEQRWFLVNKIQTKCVFVVFTIRGEKIRVISARYMRAKEAKHYESWFKEE